MSRSLILATALAAIVTPASAAIEMPPPRYDHKPAMPWVVQTDQARAQYSMPEPFGCGSVRLGSVACTFVYGGTCYTYVIKGMRKSDMAAILRHERGHCNGWRHHPGSENYRATGKVD